MKNSGRLIVAGTFGLLLAQGMVGIGIPNPTERLHVAGRLRLEGAFMPNNNAGTPGQVLKSQGTSTPPQWETIYMAPWAIDAWHASANSARGWTCTGCGGSPPYLYDCTSGFRMLGGYQICGSGCSFSKIYDALPPHSSVYIELFYFAIDTWDHGLSGTTQDIDYVQIVLENDTLSQCYPPPLYVRASPCGTSTGSDVGPFRCTAYAAHTAESLTIRIEPHLNNTDHPEYLGIVAVKLYLIP